jgi:hypothetical protein
MQFNTPEILRCHFESLPPAPGDGRGEGEPPVVDATSHYVVWTWIIAMLFCALAGPVCAEEWEVVYDGVDSAADNVPNHLRWDSALDDDWDDPPSTFRLNWPSPGFMTVDRVTRTLDHNKTGNIWIRDPILSHAAGFTMEVGVRLLPNSNLNAFSMTYLDNAGSFGVHLSPNQIKAGNLAAGGAGVTVARNTTDAQHIYRIVKLAGSRTIRVYVDDNPTPVITGSGDTNYATGSSPYLEYPRVLIGDNENNTIYNANYVMDFVRYRRGATAPGQTPPVFPPRVLPALPPPAPSGGSELWRTGYDGIGQPLSSGWIQGGGSTFFQQPGGIMELNTLATPGNARVDTVTGWSNQAGLTLEARIKVFSDSEEGGFNLAAMDSSGDTSLVLSTDKAQLMHFSVPVGAATVMMDTTDDFHIYRLTREASGLYWHLYIDDKPVAAIAHQHAGGTLLSFTRIWFGDIAYPVPANGAHVLIDYIRWHEGANAPPPLIAGDYDHDNDVDADDSAIWRRNFGSTSALAADGNGNGVVDAADYVIWRKRLGASASASQTAVPEPTTPLLLLLAITAVSTRIRLRFNRCQRERAAAL